jgi:hypothetical protein
LQSHFDKVGDKYVVSRFKFIYNSALTHVSDSAPFVLDARLVRASPLLVDGLFRQLDALRCWCRSSLAPIVPVPTKNRNSSNSLELSLTASRASHIYYTHSYSRMKFFPTASLCLAGTSSVVAFVPSSIVTRSRDVRYGQVCMFSLVKTM